MKNICWLDIIILLPLVYGLIRGLMRGMITELNTVLALVLGMVGARIWGPELALWIQHTSEWHIQLCTILSYVTIFLAIAIVLNLLGAAFSKLLKAIKLGWVNRLLGGILGILKWALIVLVLVFVTGQIDKQFQILPNDLKQRSIVYQPALDSANHIWKQVKQEQP